MLNRVRRADMTANVVAFRAAPAEIRKRINDATHADLSPAWVQEIERPAHTFSNAQSEFIRRGARTMAHMMGITAFAGSYIEPDPRYELARAYEFGALNREAVKEYRGRSPKGKRYKMKRRTQRQIPTRSTRGWIAYPAKDRMASRVGKLYGAIVSRVLHDATEGK